MAIGERHCGTLEEKELEHGYFDRNLTIRTEGGDEAAVWLASDERERWLWPGRIPPPPGRERFAAEFVFPSAVYGFLVSAAQPRKTPLQTDAKKPTVSSDADEVIYQLTICAANQPMTSDQ